VVQKSGSLKSVKQRFEFRCIYYEDKLANTRQIEEYIDRCEEDSTASNRKQEYTTLNVRSCPYFVILSRKQRGRRDVMPDKSVRGAQPIHSQGSNWVRGVNGK
jgi:hypothetical protein